MLVLVGQREEVGLVAKMCRSLVEQPFILLDNDSSVAELGLSGEVEVIKPEEPKIDFGDS